MSHCGLLAAFALAAAAEGRPRKTMTIPSCAPPALPCLPCASAAEERPLRYLHIPKTGGSFVDAGVQVSSTRAEEAASSTPVCPSTRVEEAASGSSTPCSKLRPPLRASKKRSLVARSRRSSGGARASAGGPASTSRSLRGIVSARPGTPATRVLLDARSRAGARRGSISTQVPPRHLRPNPYEPSRTVCAVREPAARETARRISRTYKVIPGRRAPADPGFFIRVRYPPRVLSFIHNHIAASYIILVL